MRGKRRKKESSTRRRRLTLQKSNDRKEDRPTTGSPANNRRSLSGGRKEGLTFNPILFPPRTETHDRSNQETLRQKQCLEKIGLERRSDIQYPRG
jgi:hypothetical protein